MCTVEFRRLSLLPPNVPFFILFFLKRIEADFPSLPCPTLLLPARSSHWFHTLFPRFSLPPLQGTLPSFARTSCSTFAAFRTVRLGFFLTIILLNLRDSPSSGQSVFFSPPSKTAVLNVEQISHVFLWPPVYPHPACGGLFTLLRLFFSTGKDYRSSFECIPSNASLSNGRHVVAFLFP